MICADCGSAYESGGWDGRCRACAPRARRSLADVHASDHAKNLFAALAVSPADAKFAADFRRRCAEAGVEVGTNAWAARAKAAVAEAAAELRTRLEMFYASGDERILRRTRDAECPKCGRVLRGEGARTSHMRAHARREARREAAADAAGEAGRHG